MSILLKQCSKCKRELPVSEFHKRPDRRNGLTSQCKDCRRAHHDTHKKEIAKSRQAYYKNHKAEAAERGHKYRQANKTKVAECKRKYQQSHKPEMNECSRKWRKANPENVHARVQRRRARKRGGAIEKFLDTEIFERDGWMCGICGMKINRRLTCPHPRSKSIDHIIPISRGGGHIRANVQAAHLRCNLSKGTGRGSQLRLIG